MMARRSWEKRRRWRGENTREEEQEDEAKEEEVGRWGKKEVND